MMLKFRYPRPKPVEVDKYVDTTQAVKKEFLHQVAQRRDEIGSFNRKQKQEPKPRDRIDVCFGH